MPDRALPGGSIDYGIGECHWADHGGSRCRGRSIEVTDGMHTSEHGSKHQRQFEFLASVGMPAALLQGKAAGCARELRRAVEWPQGASSQIPLAAKIEQMRSHTAGMPIPVELGDGVNAADATTERAEQ